MEESPVPSVPSGGSRLKNDDFIKKGPRVRTAHQPVKSDPKPDAALPAKRDQQAMQVVAGLRSVFAKKPQVEKPAPTEKAPKLGHQSAKLGHSLLAPKKRLQKDPSPVRDVKNLMTKQAPPAAKRPAATLPPVGVVHAVAWIADCLAGVAVRPPGGDGGGARLAPNLVGRGAQLHPQLESVVAAGAEM